MVVERGTPLVGVGQVHVVPKSWCDGIMFPQASSGLPKAWLSVPPIAEPKLLLDIPKDMRGLMLSSARPPGLGWEEGRQNLHALWVIL